jgi:hypothetical protein
VRARRGVFFGCLAFGAILAGRFGADGAREDAAVKGDASGRGVAAFAVPPDVSASGPDARPEAPSFAAGRVAPPLRDDRAPPSAADEEALLRLLDEARDEPDPVRRQEMFAGVCLRWAAFDPSGAIKLAADLGLDPRAGSLVPNLAQQWAAGDIDAAQAWARRLPAGELRDDVYSRIIYERARREPELAAALLAEMRPGRPARAEAALTLLHLWAERDRKAAGAWVAGRPAGELRDHAARELRAASLAAAE